MAYALAIHGGALFTDKQHPDWQPCIDEILTTLSAQLHDGISSMDAVESAVTHMEASGIFNAGRGAVKTRHGTYELDAAIMDGYTGKAGAAATLTRLQHPINAARLVMQNSPHVLMSGPHAESWLIAHGAKAIMPHDNWFTRLEDYGASPHGTVGAVALDQAGHLAAATSTGGLNGKLSGRIADSALIGCGTWADRRVAISCTGRGDDFIRSTVASDLAARLHYARQTLIEAAPAALHRCQRRANNPEGGIGGLIAIDHQGNIAMPFNCKGMIRGSASSTGQHTTAIN